MTQEIIVTGCPGTLFFSCSRYFSGSAMKMIMDFRKFDGVVGGVEQVVSQIISRIVKQDHQIILWSNDDLIPTDA